MKKIYFQKRLLESFPKNRERIAIEYGAREIKYSQLEKMCLSVSHWLLCHKTRKGSSIGIYIEDKVDFIAVLLGILNTGGVFIPLDTHLPVKRIEKMLQVTQPGLIICDQQGQGRLLHHLQTSINLGKIICTSQVFNEQDDLQLSLEDVVEYSSEDPIYVYFTSGTTGTPKAILGKNISLLHFINWEIQTFAIDETFRVSQLTRQGFDAFLRDLFVPLVVGGTLCIPGNSEILMDSDSLIYWLETNRIGLVHCVPSIFRIFNTKALKKENFQHLKYILLSGESIIPQELKNWFDIMGDRIQLVNLYGPTETTLVKTCYYIKKEDVNRGRIPIGKPMKGARLILFDKNMKICEPGFIGDIYIRTPYRTFGYLNDPQLNLERFIPNPLGGEQTDLLFKTGDQGVELPEGDFEFLGRRDRQVKIRGIRVELEEVERMMIQHPSIDNAAVIDREEKDRDKYLCAYFISRGTVEISELREYLSEELPDYLIPSYFLQLEAFPFSPNGKLDRKALPAPGLRPVENDEAPVGRIQETLVNIWSEVLKVDRKQIGINSDFFELGGHSLKATLMTVKIHKELAVKLPLVEVFKNATIEGLAQIIKKAANNPSVSIKPAEEKEYYPLSSAQRRIYFQEQMEKSNLSYHMFSVVELEGNLDRQKFQETLKQMVKRHESLRTSFEIQNQEPVQRIHKNVKFQVDYFEMSQEAAGRKVEKFIQSFEIDKAPLFKSGLLRLGANKYLLIYNMHHIISDGVSYSIFLREFIALYRGENLPGLRLRYKDYSEWQQQVTPGVIKHQERFWLKQFQTKVPQLTMPTDYPESGQRSFKGDRVEFEMHRELSQKVKQLVLKTDTTLFMLLLAVYNVLLSKYTRQTDIVVGIPVSARTHPDLSSLIGMMVNMLALRNFPLQQKTFRSFLKEVKNNALDSFENQDYPFEELIKKLAVNRSSGGNPLFSTVFALNNFDAPTADFIEMKIPGLKIKPYPYENKISHFDLVLHTNETNNNTIRICLEYSTEMYNESTARKILERYVEILQQVVEDDHIPMENINISHGLLMSKTDVLQDNDSNFGF